VDAIDQFVLGIALQVQQMVAGFTGAALQILVDLRQGRCAVECPVRGCRAGSGWGRAAPVALPSAVPCFDEQSAEPGDYAAKPL
jgi:hypothetical protein